MAQHFLLSPAARSLSLAKVARMSAEEAHDAFRLIRWADLRKASQFARVASAARPTNTRRASSGSARLARISLALPPALSSPAASFRSAYS
jgi:hypothetical protein